MSVSSTEHLDKLAFILYDRPAGRNVIGYAIEKIEQLRADNERLRADLATQNACCDGAAAQDAHVRQEREEHRAEVNGLRREIKNLREAIQSLAERLEVDPSGTDKIDDLEAEIERQRAEIERLRADNERLFNEDTKTRHALKGWVFVCPDGGDEPTHERVAAVVAEVERLRAENERLREALTDMLAGWRYIRETYGDLAGIGWDRAESKAQEALEGKP